MHDECSFWCSTLGSVCICVSSEGATPSTIPVEPSGSGTSGASGTDDQLSSGSGDQSSGSPVSSGDSSGASGTDDLLSSGSGDQSSGSPVSSGDSSGASGTDSLSGSGSGDQLSGSFVSSGDSSGASGTDDLLSSGSGDQPSGSFVSSGDSSGASGTDSLLDSGSGDQPSGSFVSSGDSSGASWSGDMPSGSGGSSGSGSGLDILVTFSGSDSVFSGVGSASGRPKRLGRQRSSPFLLTRAQVSSDWTPLDQDQEVGQGIALKRVDLPQTFPAAQEKATRVETFLASPQDQVLPRSPQDSAVSHQECFPLEDPVTFHSSMAVVISWWIAHG